MEDVIWLKETVAAMKSADAGFRSGAELGYADLPELCPEVGVYVERLTARGAGCSIGNFDFWSPDRLRAREDAPQAYGGDAALLLIGDWMLDSEFCAVDVSTGLMVFLGGDSPIRSKLGLAEFLEKVASDPVTPHGMQ